MASLSSSAVGHPAGPVLLFDSLGVYRMLSSVTDPAGIEAFMKDQLGTLLDYDKRHHSDLLVTLAQYFDVAAISTRRQRCSPSTGTR